MKRRLQIGVFGSHSDNLEKDVIASAESIGRKIAETGNILITGASSGISYHAAKGAKEAGGLTVGILPDTFRGNNIPSINTDYIDVQIASGFGFKGRNVISVRSCDAAVFINGGSGTLNELMISLDEMEGPSIILKESGGISSFAHNIFEVLGSKANDKIILCDLESLLETLTMLNSSNVDSYETT